MTRPRLSLIERFTILLAAWAGFIYLLLFALQLSGQMLDHAVLQLVVFGPAALLAGGLVLHEARIRRRR